MYEITYKMTLHDWVSAYRIGKAHLRLSPIIIVGLSLLPLILVLMLAIFYKGFERAWQRQGAFPWHFVRDMLPSFAVGPAAFVLFMSLLLWLMSTRRVTLESPGITIRSKAGKVLLSWKRVSGIFRDADYIAISSDGFDALVIPRHAFLNDQSAADFLNDATALWHKSNGTLSPVQDETVWPPAPRPGV